jgi:hypothetical protein
MRYILIDHSLEDEIDGTCSTYGKITKVWLENLIERHLFEDLGLDGWNILN